MPIKPEHFGMSAEEIEADLGKDQPDLGGGHVEETGEFVRGRDKKQNEEQEGESDKKDLPDHLL